MFKKLNNYKPQFSKNKMNNIIIKKNPLLHREEVILQVEENFPPSNQEAAKKISEQTKKSENLIVIDKISSKFGAKIFTIKAKVYESEEAKNRMETVARKIKKKLAKEAADTAGKK